MRRLLLVLGVCSAAVLAHAAPAPKERRFYDADHSMATAPVAADRDAWLVKELGLLR